MIEKARDLNSDNQKILLAYLHALHMQELLTQPRDPQWVYRNIQAHWLRQSAPSAHWVG